MAVRVEAITILFLYAEADSIRKVNGRSALPRCARGSYLSALASPSKEEGAGGDELRTGLVDSFGARIFQTKYSLSATRENARNNWEGEQPRACAHEAGRLWSCNHLSQRYRSSGTEVCGQTHCVI